MTGRVYQTGSGGLVRQCPICLGLVSARYWAIVRHLARHRPGDVLTWIRGR